MATGHISVRSVDALKWARGEDRAVLWDDSVKGFGVIAHPTGRKVFVAQYRDKGGRSRRVNLGNYGTLTAFEARGMAKELLGSVAGGANPAEDSAKARAVPTLAAVAEDFLQDTAAKRKPRTAENYRLTLQTHVLPILGARRITDVRRSDLAEIHRSLEKSPYAANLVLAIISSLWRWAVQDAGEVSEAGNPAKGIKRYPEHKRERFLTADELARLGDALRETPIDPFAVAALRLLILTGARLREILGAKWEQVDTARGILFLPDSKTGAKPIYLNAPALAILAELPHIEGNPHIIPGQKSAASRTDLKKPWRTVCKAATLEGVRIHDLRHSFASVGAGGNLGLPIIGKLLGHTQASTTQRYAHLASDPMRRAADQIGAEISAAMDRKPGATIVPINKARG